MPGRRWAPKPWEEAYRTQGRLWGGSRLDTPTARLLEAHPGLRQGAWLDLGCGDGKGLVPLRTHLDDAAPAPVGCDLSRWGLRRAREACRDAAVPPLPLVQADARRLPFPDGMFDAVRAVHIVGHLLEDGPARAARAVHRVLRPGGVVLSTEFGRDDLRAGKGEPVAPWTWRRGTGIVTRYWRPDELEALWRDAGFEDAAAETERFTVDYGGVPCLRERHTVVARRP